MGSTQTILEIHGSQQAGDPYDFRGGAQEYILRTEGGGAETATILWDAALLQELGSLRAATQDPEIVQRLGNRLRDFLAGLSWPPDELARAITAGEPVHISLRLGAAELFSLPWELLALRPSGQHLGELPNVLLRYEWPETHSAAEQPSPQAEGGRILFAWSAAGGVVPAAEHEAALARAAEKGRLPFDRSRDPLPQVSIEGLAARLEEAARRNVSIAALHILCHGTASGAAFGLAWNGGPGGEVDVVDGGRLRRLLGPHAGRVRMVVLCACHSSNPGPLGSHLGSIAQTLHRIGIQAVVASRFPLSVDGSILLSNWLYDGLLGELVPLETALPRARAELVRKGNLDWASLQLHSRWEDGQDTRPFTFRPYRGLLAFGPEHSQFFFGRDREAAEIQNDLAALRQHHKPRFLVIAGASGTGKSSLVLAQAATTICAREGCTWQVLRPSAGGLEALDALVQRRSQSMERGGLLLIIDQFEEIFTALETESRDALARRLWAVASDPQSNIQVIATLRVDFIGRCGDVVLDHTGLRLDRVAYDEAHRVFIAQMEPEALRQAIAQPAARVGLALEPGLVDRMLADVGSEPGALPLLEYTLDLLWQRRQGRTLTQTAYQELGGIGGALEQEAERVFSLLEPARQKTARQLLVGLVTMGESRGLDTRRRRRLAELRPADKTGALRFDGVVDQLVAARLLVRSEERAAPTVEVAHEALIRRWKRLRSWIDEEALRQAQAPRRWRWVVPAAAGVLLACMLGSAAGVLWLWNRRVRESREAEVRREQQLQDERRRAEREAREQRVAALLNAAHKHPPLARPLLLEAADLTDQPPPDGVELLNQLLEQPLPLADLSGFDQYADGDPSAKVMAITPDGLRILIAAGATLQLWPIDGRGPPIVLREPDGHSFDMVTLSPDGKRIATRWPGNQQSEVWLWRSDGRGEPLRLDTLGGHFNSLEWSRDGSRLVTANGSDPVLLWRPDTTTAPVVTLRHNQRFKRASFSPDGSRISAASEYPWDIWIWRSDGQGNPIKLDVPSQAESLQWSPDGSRILVYFRSPEMQLWRSDGTGHPSVLKGHAKDITSASFSPDGSRIATASSDGTVRIWQVDGSQETMVLKGHRGGVDGAVWSPDGKQLATYSEDGTVRLWRTDGSGQPAVLRKQISYLGWSPDSTRIITHWWRTVQVWRVEDLLARASDENAASRRSGKTWPELIQALRSVTVACLTVPERMDKEILQETEAQAKAGYAACARRYGR